MKKLLILLLLSLAFLGSSNANSIDGAFGYKLGQVDEGTRNIIYEPSIYTYKLFNPVKPLPPFDEYLVRTTLNERKIYEIKASHREASTNKNSCFEQESTRVSHLYKILRLLKAKYGNFKMTSAYNDNNTLHWRTYKYIDGDRSIKLSCGWGNKKGVDEASTLTLQYLDSELENLSKQEGKELVRKKALEESQDYDI